MKLEINKLNYKSFLRQEKFLRIDNDFLILYQITENSSIEIKDIKDKSIIFWIFEIDLKSLKFEISESSFEGFFVEKSKFSELNIISVEVSEFKNTKYKPYKTYIDNSFINRIWCFFSTFYNGFLIRAESEVSNVLFNDCTIDHSFTFVNSKASELLIESSKLDNISIDRNEYPKKVEKTSIEKINVFRSEINKNLRICGIEFITINLHKIRLYKTENLSEHNNEIYISVPDGYSDSEKIEIAESSIAAKIIISINSIKELRSYNSIIQDYTLNFINISNFYFQNNQILGNIFWGFQDNLKTIEKFAFNNCTVSGGFYLSDIIFSEQLHIKGSLFHRYPSFFMNNRIQSSCDVDFEYTNLTNFVFQDIEFENVSFKSFDIIDAEFKNCSWTIERKHFFERYIVFDEISNSKKVENLILVKNIYYQLKDNFQKNKDYLTSGKFHISEQDIKRQISLRKKSWFEFFLLSCHKSISSYGENLSKPLVLILIFMICFSFIYLFTGFYSQNRLIQYEFYFEPKNVCQMLFDWLQSCVISLKNVLPFSVNNEFFMSTNPSVPITQFIELIHKLLNLILATSFTEAFIRYLKK